MRTHLVQALTVALSLSLAGCVYVTRVEYDGFLDVDGDGWPMDDDCDDNNPDIYPYAPDKRGDGCDADCGMERDSDGDDWPDVADCGPNDPDSHPCSAAEVDGDGQDHDCDGRDAIRPDTCNADDPDYEESPTPENCGGGK